MTQMRTFLILAWLMVAGLLWFEWGKYQDAKQRPAPVAAPVTAPAVAPLPGATAATTPAAAVPAAAPGAVPVVTSSAPAAAAPTQAQPTITLSNDVVRLVLDGSSVRRAELLQYRVKNTPDAPLVRLFDDDPAHFYAAYSGWVSSQGAPNHQQGGFVAETAAREAALADGADTVSTAFRWTGPNGVSIRRTYTLKRGDYALTVRDEVVNAGTAQWTGHIYRQLVRVPQVPKRSMTDPESFAFNGAAWYTPEEKYEKRAFADFVDDGPINHTAAGGWVALLQHYFFAAWIPQADQQAALQFVSAGNQQGIAAVGPAFAIAPGARQATEARLWIGPKLAERLDGVAPGLGLALDYGVMTILAEPIHWTLTKLHKVTQNWGWAIVLLVLLLKLMLYPLSAAQYKSMAKMRKVQPRIQQLKERYGEDKQKFQMAMLELYKKEKINPAGGCLPILIQMPVFLALYWVLIESVELRQAPWMLWIQDLTARDPFFILPAINMAVMWFTQRLSPMVGVDPIQARMMQLMPLVFGVMFAFFPAGLVLYWVTNGALGLAQQWWMMRTHGDGHAKA